MNVETPKPLPPLKTDAGGYATAELNPGRVLDIDVDTMPPVLFEDDQEGGPIRYRMVTVIKAGGGHGDLACYRALVPIKVLNDPANTTRVMLEVSRYGSKLRRNDALKIFEDLQRYGEYRV